MATIAQSPLAAAVVPEEPAPPSAGDPAILGLPIFVVGSIALGVYLFLNAADTATGGRGCPLGPALRR